MALSFISSASLVATTSTASATTKRSDIGSRVKELLLSIPAQQGVALNQVAKVLCEEFGLNLEKAYLRIQILFKGGKGLRGWCQHLVKMQHSKDGYVIIFNTLPASKTVQVMSIEEGLQEMEANMRRMEEADAAADKLADLGIN